MSAGRTQRLDVRPLALSHAVDVFPLLHDDRMYAYIPDRRYDSVEALTVRYRRLVAGSGDPDETWLNWTLNRQADGRALGMLQATVTHSRRVAEIAYVLAPPFWGQGYAGEAVAWLLQALKASDLAEVARARIDERNAASIALALRLGFERRGVVTEDGTTDLLFERET